MSKDIVEMIGRMGVVPVIAIEQAKDAQQLGQALIDGGLPCAEITFRTAAARDSIAILASQFPQMLVGAGTILTVAQAEQAQAAGAQFIVTPGFDAQVVAWCINQGLPIMPGVLTPTEINMALNQKLHLLKFFPAEASGGVKLLKAIGGPYKNVKFIPTGGINPDNLATYLRLANVHACGGSWMVPQQRIAAGQFAEITRLAAEAVSIVQEIRRGVS